MLVAARAISLLAPVPIPLRPQHMYVPASLLHLGCHCQTHTASKYLLIMSRWAINNMVIECIMSDLRKG